MKRTPKGEGKTLKPCAYKLSEPARVTACLLNNDPASYCHWLAKVLWTGA